MFSGSCFFLEIKIFLSLRIHITNKKEKKGLKKRNKVNCCRWLFLVLMTLAIILGYSNKNQDVAARERSSKVNSKWRITAVSKKRNKKIKKIYIKKKSFVLEEGQTLLLKVKIKPKEASNQNLKYTSTNSNIITVNSKGVVRAVSVGNAKVKVRTADGSKRTLKIKFTVRPEESDIFTEEKEVVEDTEVENFDMDNYMDETPFLTDIVEKKTTKEGVIPAYVGNRLHLFWNENVSENRKREILVSIGAKKIGLLSEAEVWQIELHEKYEEYEILHQYIQYLRNVYEEILYAEPEWVFTDVEQVDFDDPWYGIGTDWWIDAVEGSKAWEYAEQMSSLKIAVIDNGIDVLHEDLQVHFSKGKYEGENSVERHGTHVAGIIGATADNAKGITGLAWMHKVYGYDWQPVTGQKWITSAKIYNLCVNAVTDGCKIINLSLGISGSLSDASQTYANISINCWGFATSLLMGRLLEKGYDFVVVQSAGNGAKDGMGVDAVNNGYFCSITEGNCYQSKIVTKADILNRILIVGAVEPTGSGFMQTSFSNGGSAVDITAPGMSIYSCLPENSYGRLSGTSMAAPIVSSVAAMVWGMDETLTGEEVTKTLLDTANQTAADNRESLYAVGAYPMVNAGRAVKTVAKGDYEIYLTWENSELDLDAHLRGINAKGEDIHVYFGKNGYEMAELIKDSRGDVRKEKIIIRNLDDIKEFSFAVHNYTDCKCDVDSSDVYRLSNAGVLVEVYKGNIRLKSYSMEINQSATEWQVFTITRSGEIQDVNQLKITPSIWQVLR